MNARQLWKCNACMRQFVGGNRLDHNKVIEDYVVHKMTLEELSSKYLKSVSTIQRCLRKMRHVHVISREKDVTVLLDTTYWGRNFGLMVIKDALRNKILWRKYVRHETIADYMEGIEWLRLHGFRIYGAVCDGMKGLFKALYPIPVQMCQVHQQRIVRTYLTSKPELDASIELLELSKTMTSTDKESFIGAFNLWHERWREFLSERSIDKATGKKRYTHRRLRSAYLSLKRNMPYLWPCLCFAPRGTPSTAHAIG